MARLNWRNPHWDGKRKEMLIAISAAGVMLLLLFLGNMVYLYGSVYQSNSKFNRLNILAVDYDGGIIGQSLQAAYNSLQGDEFPTLQYHTATDFPTVADVQNAVCKGDYWGAIVTQPGASNRLAAALSGGNAAANYNRNDTITYIFNGVRYATVELGDVAGNLATLAATTSGYYHAMNGTAAAQILDTSNTAAILAFTDPISAVQLNIAPIPASTRVLLNTVSVVIPIISQFFFLMALNGINNQFGTYGHLKSSRVGFMRAVISLVYTFLSSLTVIGYFWAFKEDWSLNAGQFLLSWMGYWLYLHVNFLVLDTVTAFIPMSFLSFAVLTWAIINITASLLPFELNPGFYKWGYALPGHHVYSIMVTIWSGGCNNKLYISLPVLFAWEVVGLVASVAGVFRRNRLARMELKKTKSIAEPVEEEKHTASRAYSDGSTDESVELKPYAAGAGFPMPFVNDVGSQRLVRKGDK